MKKILIYLLVLLFVTGYLATWALGVPMLHTSISQKVLERHESPREQPYKFKPFIKFEYAFPVLPFIIFSKHEFAFATQGGEGGYYLCVWFVDDTRQWQLSGYTK